MTEQSLALAGPAGILPGPPGQVGEGLTWLAAGGPVMYVIFGLSVLALAVILLKLYQFAVLRVGSRAFVEEALEHWRRGRSGEALACLAASRSPVARVLEVAMAGQGRGTADETKVREETARVATLWLERLRAHLRLLEVVAALSPLLGLLGTVLGMIEAFQQLQAAGSHVNPAILAGGIWEALLTTAAGLGVAIPTVAVLHGLEFVVDSVGHTMEDAATRVFTRGIASASPADEARRATPVEPERAY